MKNNSELPDGSPPPHHSEDAAAGEPKSPPSDYTERSPEQSSKAQIAKALLYFAPAALLFQGGLTWFLETKFEARASERIAEIKEDFSTQLNQIKDERRELESRLEAADQALLDLTSSRDEIAAQIQTSPPFIASVATQTFGQVEELDLTSLAIRDSDGDMIARIGEDMRDGRRGLELYSKSGESAINLVAGDRQSMIEVHSPISGSPFSATLLSGVTGQPSEELSMVIAGGGPSTSASLQSGFDSAEALATDGKFTSRMRVQPKTLVNGETGKSASLGLFKGIQEGIFLTKGTTTDSDSIEYVVDGAHRKIPAQWVEPAPPSPALSVVASGLVAGASSTRGGSYDLGGAVITHTGQGVYVVRVDADRSLLAPSTHTLSVVGIDEDVLVRMVSPPEEPAREWRFKLWSPRDGSGLDTDFLLTLFQH